MWESGSWSDFSPVRERPTWPAKTRAGGAPRLPLPSQQKRSVSPKRTRRRRSRRQDSCPRTQGLLRPEPDPVGELPDTRASVRARCLDRGGRQVDRRCDYRADPVRTLAMSTPFLSGFRRVSRSAQHDRQLTVRVETARLRSTGLVRRRDATRQWASPDRARLRRIGRRLRRRWCP